MRRKLKNKIINYKISSVKSFRKSIKLENITRQ